MVQPLKDEIDRMLQLGVIQKLDINQATDWCHESCPSEKAQWQTQGLLGPQIHQQGITV